MIEHSWRFIIGSEVTSARVVRLTNRDACCSMEGIIDEKIDVGPEGGSWMDDLDLNKHAVILFDGVCSFCNGAVQFIIRRDRNAYFRFASLQSSAAQTLLAKQKLPPNIDSIVVLEKGRVHTESTAILRIAAGLDGLWKTAVIFWIIPRPLRDVMYRFVARHRYRWFGKRSECMIPTPEQRLRFLSLDEADD